MKANRVLFRQPASLLLTIALAGSIPAYAQTASTDTTTTTTTAAAPAAPTPAPAPAAVDQSTTTQQGVTVLTPFEVNSTKDQGYFAANTLAGTRLNNNIADLPSSVTVVTKQQLEDTASQNINDVFRYEADTQGVSTYTPTTGNSATRSNVSDSLAGSGGTQAFAGTSGYNSALDTGNRVRGLAAADLEVNNFYSLYRVPFDSYNLDALEIERGPNSIIFGTGSPAGIVNSDTTSANVDKLSGSASYQIGSWGKERETFGLNIPIIKDTLGLYVAQVYDSEGFKQKPSSDITRREYAAFTYYPFKSHKTKLSGMIEGFNEYTQDPNYITPQDFVTPWLNSGRPVYNPVTDMVTYLATGKTVGPYAVSSTYPNYAGILQANLTTTSSPYFVPSITYNGHIVEAIYNGNVEDTFKGQQTGFNGLTSTGLNDVPTQFSGLPSTASTFIGTPAQALIASERMTNSTNGGVPLYSSPFLANGNPKYAVFQIPTVSSKSVYDWSNINTASADNTTTQNLTYNLNFEQVILPDLTFQVSFFRQELHQTIDSPTDQANASTLNVDTNSYLLNGAPDPHVGQPFIDVYQADVYSFPEINTNWRAMLDYEPDLRGHVPSYLEWLGHHRFLGLFSQHDDVQTGLRFRPSIDGGDPNYLPTSTNLAAVNGYAITGDSAIEQWLFMAPPGYANNGVGVTSPGFYNRPNYGGATNVPIQTFNYVTNQWYTANVHVDSVLFATGGLQENLQDSKTFFWQSFFFDDRVVGSIGMNEDQVKNRQTLFPSTANASALEYPNGYYPNQSLWYNEGGWNDIGGNTSTTGVVLHPFKNWSMIDGAAANGNLLAAAIRSISFTYNKSDNFNSPPGFYTDYFGNPLGKPTGKEKDYGLEIASPDNKFFLRFTKFTTSSANVLTNFTSTGRATYLDTLMNDWAQEVVEVRNGENPTLANFNNTGLFPITSAELTQIAALKSLPVNYGGNVGSNGEFVNPNGTESGTAKGYEVEATYNPLPNWTMKVTWAHQQTITTGAGAVGQAYVNYRLPTWEAAAAPDLPNIYTLSNGNPLYLGSFWQGYGFDASTSGPGITNDAQAYFNTVEGSQLAADEAPNGTLAPNQVQYSWTYLTNYTIDRGPLKNLSLGGALRYTGDITVGYYGSTNVNSLGEIYGPDITKPIIQPGKYHVDAFVGYQFKMPWDDKIKVKVQFNVSDLTSNGYLLPVSYNYDGTAAAYRIIAPRAYSLEAKFDF
jgi:outer membrane receptor protein involved in Fe transport